MLAVAFTEYAGWKPGLVLLKWILGLSLTFPSLGRVVYSSQLKANTQLPVGTKSSSCGTASCKCWVQRFHEGPLTKKISIFIKLEKKKYWLWFPENVSWRSCWFQCSFEMTRPWKLLWMAAVLHPPISWFKSSQQLYWSRDSSLWK